ncbi:hypothetical protein NDA11_005651 [Ustilago hordei]|uniref:Uncharacterized protein n=1 Tax=Ustilago hordei TaxID=120017 RepID=I2FX78_USTHO|nr:hypothetical protein NDA10_005159 [Ustilago hordei]KAJ1573721.1 hypothetical protein NDA15_002433 [Ustilago hordei]KAJ1579405.1 hypothetical protein NDA11_005651 [Ustilago hordei]KAJ1579668.1 hypothetical protein NDA12_004132 [Ustilago hordei]KAJ1598468.1 hypothetical protein NDA14_001260 [Ustilago hordei]
MADDAILHDASAERRCLGALRPLVLMISSNKDNEDGMSYLIGHHSSRPHCQSGFAYLGCGALSRKLTSFGCSTSVPCFLPETRSCQRKTFSNCFCQAMLSTLSYRP